MCVCVCVCGGDRDIMVIVIGNVHDEPSSNPELGVCISHALNTLWYKSNLSASNNG